MFPQIIYLNFQHRTGRRSRPITPKCAETRGAPAVMDPLSAEAGERRAQSAAESSLASIGLCRLLSACAGDVTLSQVESSQSRAHAADSKRRRCRFHVLTSVSGNANVTYPWAYW